MRLKKDKITIDEVRRRTPSLDSTKGGETVMPRPDKTSIEDVRASVGVLAEGQPKVKKAKAPEPEIEEQDEEIEEEDAEEAPAPKAKKKKHK